MVKKATKVELNTFIKGLITEASPLNFPQNASFDEENFELDHTGKRSRRLGMRFEDNYSGRDPGVATSYLTNLLPVTHQWIGASGNEDLTITVVQVNNRLDFYDSSKSSLTNYGYLGSLTALSIGVNAQCSFTNVDGKLVVVDGTGLVGVVSYEGGVFSITYVTLMTRDVWGVEETLGSYETDNSYRGSTNDRHTYNLYNQSWGIPRKDSTGTMVDPTTKYNADLGVYPSNSETVWVGLQFQAVAPAATPFERLYTNMFQESLGADTKAPKGYFIIQVLNRGAGRVAAFSSNSIKYTDLDTSSVTLPTDSTPGGPSIVCEFAGRVWYGGFSGEVSGGDARSPNLTNYLFFSQLVKSKQDFGKCYQEGDPTSRENSDIVDTDGGFVRISGMNKPVGMVNLGSSLIVIADNGVWRIVGGSDYGFTPSNYKVEKLSAFGGVSRFSIVEQLGRAFYWGNDGIYVVSKNQFGDYEVNSITETTIQTYYESLSNDAKRRVVGIYDDFGKKIRWVFKVGTYYIDYDSTELIFDIVTNAFTKNRIFGSVGNNIEVMSIIPPNIHYNLPRYLCVTNVLNVPTYVFGAYTDTTWHDWPHTTAGGVDAYAYMITGEQTGGDSSLPKQIPYLIMHFVRTESGVDSNLVPEHRSACMMRMRWDWSNNTTSKKWSKEQQIYRYRKPRMVTDPLDTYDTGFTVVTSKNKIRGRGKAFAMAINTVENYDCQVLGWNLSVDANAIT